LNAVAALSLLIFVGVPAALLSLGFAMHRFETSQRQRALGAAAASARLQVEEDHAAGRRAGLDVRVDVKRRLGKRRIFEVNFGAHRLGATLRFSAHKRDRSWTNAWRVEAPVVQMHQLDLDRVARILTDDAETLRRIFAEPDVAPLATKLMHHGPVGLFAIDTRRVFSLLLAADADTDLGDIIDDGAALCARLTAVSPAGGGQRRRLAAAGAGSGSPLGLPSTARPRSD
jgi:hypothetical protein